jgi:hypothetical protein
MNNNDDVFDVINKIISLPCLNNSDFHRISTKNLAHRFIRRIKTSNFQSPGFSLRIEFEPVKFFEPTEDFSIEELEHDLIGISNESITWKCESVFKAVLQQYYDIMSKEKGGYPKYDLKMFENRSRYRISHADNQTGELTPTSIKSADSINKTWASIVQSPKSVPAIKNMDDVNIVKLYRTIPFSLTEKMRMINLLSSLNFSQEVKYWKGDRLNNEFEESSVVVYRRMTIESLDDLCEMYVVMNNMRPSEIPQNVSIINNLELIKEKLKMTKDDSKTNTEKNDR